jgi:thiamine pyrophosphokinase
MKQVIVQSQEPVTLVGGGKTHKNDLKLALTRASRLVAADGGAQVALASGEIPEAVIGDLDSLDAQARAGIPADRLFPIAEQESTDFDKALRHIAAPLVLGVGFLGARLDHQMAAFNCLVRRAKRPCVLIGEQELIFHVPGDLDLDLEVGDRVSLFPMRKVAGRSDGLEWPIEGLEFAPDGRVGTSNRVIGPVRLQMAGDGMLAMVPRSALDAVMAGLLKRR